MLDLIFAVLMIVIVVKANKGEVNDTLCNVALVIGILAGILGLVQTFLGSGGFWILNIVVMLIAFALKRVAQHFAKIYNQKKLDIETEYRIEQERFSRFNSMPGEAPDYDDPNVRFGGGNGEAWNGK